MRIVKEGELIKVVSPFNRDWVKRAKELDGKWDAPAWVFPAEHESLVRDALLSIYGENGEPSERVSVDVTLTDMRYDDEIVIAGVTAVRRHGRDSAASYENGAVLVSGGFGESGGSRVNPVLGQPKTGTVIRLKVPVIKTPELESDDRFERVTVVGTDAVPIIDLKALEEEKTRLLLRIAEIDAILSAKV